MKKILILVAVGALTLTSCKKDRTCTCTIQSVSSTENGVTQPIDPTPITYTQKLTKVSKNGAHCNSGEETDTRTETSGGTTYTTVDVTKVDCKLD